MALNTVQCRGYLPHRSTPPTRKTRPRRVHFPVSLSSFSIGIFPPRGCALDSQGASIEYSVAELVSSRYCLPMASPAPSPRCQHRLHRHGRIYSNRFERTALWLNTSRLRKTSAPSPRPILPLPLYSLAGHFLRRALSLLRVSYTGFSFVRCAS
ncbi:uncharacterized protein SCHCODRAFT_02753101 [Schizophyllum commune H4-8]|uniref:uncharacterized protein n=1 Tax=Schizophyllum commune (strain H4-8 / FGSC 9210) TaxID=578458 RepID=UPI0021608E2E|nr:uncharacterized protein SCHCODRAFT_02753101 [Schizophyllum commune H4-8]KAI5885772.1 hypothetical protein SCHCODRAFT_02753101 [Schizophyllum commune H4-8]